MNAITIIRTNGTVEQTLQSTPATLEQIQAAVGGWIELVPNFQEFNGEPCEVYCNEEGKLDGLAPNPKATGLWYAANDLGYGPDDILVGDVVILTGLAIPRDDDEDE